jgi:hypothetical protein
MSSVDETPDWWHEVIDLPLNSKPDAKRLIQLCRAGELLDTYHPEWSTYRTTEGRVRLADFEQAQDFLSGAYVQNPGRPKRQDWELIEAIFREVEKDEELTTQISVRHEVIARYKVQTGKTLGDSGTLRGNISEWQKN